MKTQFLKQVVLLMIPLLTLFSTNVWAATYTWTAGADDPDWFGVTRPSGKVTLNGKVWSFTRTNPNTCQISSSCIQFGKNGGVEDVVLSTTAIGGTITQIDVECSSYKANHTCKIEVGGTTVKTATVTGSWTTVSTVSTGTISNNGEIKITLASGASARALYVKSITVTYTPGSYNVDWMVGSTKAKSESSVSVGTPPDVDDDALGASCSGIKFLGWSKTNVGSTPDDAPTDLFTADEVPGLYENSTFYAIFGEWEYDDDGTPICIQIHKYDSWSYGGTTHDKSSYRLFNNGAYVESSAFDLAGLAQVNLYGGTCGGDSYNSVSIKDESGNVWKSGTVSGSGNAGEQIYTAESATALSGTKKLRATSTCGTSSSNGIRMTKVKIFIYPKVYSNCITSCCEGLGAIDGDVTLTKTAYTITATWPTTEDGNETGYSVQLYDNNGSGAKGSAIGSPVAITGTAAGNRTCTFGAKTPAGSRLTANYQYFIGVTPTYSGAGDYCSTGTEVIDNTTTNQTYTVTYANGGGTGTMTDSNSPYEAEDEVTVLTNTFTKPGYPFDSWSAVDASSNVIDVSSGSFTMPSSNVTITATWGAALVDTFIDKEHGGEDGHGGTSGLTRSGANKTTPNFSDYTPVNSYCNDLHYKFVGWVLSTSVNDDGTLKNDAVIVPGGQGSWNCTGSTYYAVWAAENE